MKDQGFGIVTFEGKEYALTQQPYIDGPTGETPFYRASAVDEENNAFEATWDVVDNWQEIEDEQEMVEDWDQPSNVKEI